MDSGDRSAAALNSRRASSMSPASRSATPARYPRNASSSAVGLARRIAARRACRLARSPRRAAAMAARAAVMAATAASPVATRCDELAPGEREAGETILRYGRGDPACVAAPIERCVARDQTRRDARGPEWLHRGLQQGRGRQGIARCVQDVRRHLLHDRLLWETREQWRHELARAPE